MKKVFIIIQIILLLYVLLLVIVYAGQRFMVFHPDRLDKEIPFSFDTPFEEHYIETAPGININYLLFRTKEPRKGLALYFHGNADNLKRWGEYRDDFIERGYDVVMPDYRGYGKSDGKVSEIQTYADMRVLHKHIVETERPAELIIYGRSLGSALAADLAKEVPAKMLILETPFYSIPSVFQDQLLLIWLPFDFKYQFPNYKNIPMVDYPVCIFHGTHDRVVPYRNAERLKAVLKKEDTFVTIEEGTHGDLSSFSIYQQKMDELLGYKINL